MLLIAVEVTNASWFAIGVSSKKDSEYILIVQFFYVGNVDLAILAYFF